MTQNSPIKETPTVTRVLRRKRLQATAVVALAVFLLGSMVWPLATRGYESQAEIAVDIADNPEAVESFKTILDQVVRRNLSENALKRTIDNVREEMPGKVIDRLAALPSIRPLLEVSMSPQSGRGSYLLNVKYSGKGTAAENHLLNVLTTSVASDFLAHPYASIGTGPNKKKPVLNQEFLATAQSLKNQANEAITKLERTVTDGPYAGNSGSPFMTTSSRTNITLGDDQEVSQDIGTLRETVDGLTSMIESAHSQNSSTGGSTFSVREVRSLAMKPIGCNPKLPHIIMLGLLSLMVGTAVAYNFRPLDSKGFESEYSIPSKLGIPVAARLNSRLSAKTNDEEELQHWANALVGYAELFLFATTIIVLGFCLINEEVRNAFTDNLFHGFSRIFWMFRS